MGQRIISFVAATLVMVGAFAHRAAADVIFDHRENLNVLNSPDVTITSLYPVLGNNSAGSELRGYAGETSSSGVGWFSSFTTSQKETLTIDLGAVRNIETIRATASGNADTRSITAATIETSSDGVNWSGGLAHSTTYISHTQPNQESRFVLNSAVNTRWVRITGDAYSHDAPTYGQRQIGLSQLAIYGATGTVAADKGLDIISSDGWTAAAGGGATITTTGFTQPVWLTGIAQDNEPDSDNRQLVYNMVNGDKVTATFADTVYGINRVGIGLHGASAKNMSYRFLGSTDGVNFNTVLFTHNGVTDPAIYYGPQFFTLATPFSGKAIQFEVLNVGSNPNAFISDMFAFVPEPTSSLSLMALGGLMIRRKRS